MRTSLPLLVALIAFATQAHASGVFVRWGQCLSDGGVQNKNFACDANTGSEVLVGGFQLTSDLAQVSGNEVVIDLASAGASLPAWWQFRNAGTCRQTAMTMNTFLSTGVNCIDWAAGQSQGGIGAYAIGQRGPNTARVVAALAVPVSGLADLSTGQEYFSFNLVITHAKTVGLGACAGCQTPVCLLLVSINLTTPIAANNRKLVNPSNGTDANWVTWQGGGGVTVGGATGCPAATPTLQRTWGAVKALYR